MKFGIVEQTLHETKVWLIVDESVSAEICNGVRKIRKLNFQNSTKSFRSKNLQIQTRCLSEQLFSFESEPKRCLVNVIQPQSNQ